MRVLRWLNRPWLHFIVLGIVLFQLQAYYFPEPKPVVGPLGDARIEALQQQWFATTGRVPTEQQLDSLIAAELDRELLFQRGLELDLHLYDTVVYQRLLRNMHFLGLAEGKSDQQLYDEALELRLHLGDEVIKRRLIQVMEQLLLANKPAAQVTPQDLEAEFEQRKNSLRRPPRYSIEHIYFSRERETEIAAAIASIQEQQLDASEARQFSTPFLPGYRFVRQTPDQLARQFGAAFVSNLEAANPQAGSWLGPIRSTYGQHYVWVDAIEPERDANLEEVKVQLERDLRSRNRTQALNAAVAQLREDYEVLQ